MKIPNAIVTYCPFCRKHIEHKVSLYTPGKRRALAFGELKHERKMKGHGGKRAGKKAVKKQGKRQVVILTCKVCEKKHTKVAIKSRTKKKLEVKR